MNQKLSGKLFLDINKYNDLLEFNNSICAFIRL